MRGAFLLTSVLVATACARPVSDPPPAHPPFLAAAASTRPSSPPPDPDHDPEAVAQIFDDCPDEPGRSRTKEGCSDDDDVLAGDRCPDVPETLNDFEDDDGCPDADPPHLVQLRALFAQVQFHSAKKSLSVARRPTDAGMRALRDVADILQAHPGLHLRIAVHVAVADERPFARVGLSRTRANEVRHALVDQGVDSMRLEVEGRGADEPIADPKTKAGIAMNRRVEFEVIKPLLAAASPPDPLQ